MGLEDLLLYVTSEPGAEVAASLELARRHDAHLTALHVIDIPMTPMAVEASVSSTFLEAQRAAFETTAEVAKSTVTDAASRDGIAVEWRQDEGETVWLVSQHSHYCDLLVMGTGAGRDEPPFDRALAEHVVLECGKPVLMVPKSYAGGAIGRYVTVAWNGTREAARAVANAMPLLQKAEKVSVVIVDPSKSTIPLGDVPGADICQHLSRHGVTAEAQTTERDNNSTGEAISSWAKGQGADLIVMGAYGHWRLRELVLGGATRDVLRDTAIPVLMSH